MTTINWNEIRHRALEFSHEWADAKKEDADKQTFWNEFFLIFGMRRRTVASFEHPLKNVRGKYGRLDLFWPSVLLVEHKSAGQSLDKAELQAFDYLRDLLREGRQAEMPRYVVVSDFTRFGIYDLEPDDPRPNEEYRYSEIPLGKLHEEIRQFAFIKGDKPKKVDPEDPANFEATALLCELHDSLKDAGYAGAALERFLVRVLFCLFAEDTFIFEPRQFTELLERTNPDGSDLGMYLGQLFEVLDQDHQDRQRNLDEDLAAFEYVNGALFKGSLPTAAFTSAQREKLLQCAYFHWARISPAVFGSLFQDILDGPERRQIGAHYTSERDVLKVLRSLFLDDLEKELAALKEDRSTRRAARLKEFHAKLRQIRVFDPACGCGNFLILAYRELRRIEQEMLVALRQDEPQTLFLDVRELSKVDVDQFYGIELNEWPCRIAEVGLWLADHQANRLLGEAFGLPGKRLPLRATPTIRNANALRTDWRTVLPPSNSVFVLGNPPFVGKKEQTKEQKAELTAIFADVKGKPLKGSGILDYVSAWYAKALDYIRGSQIRVAFVSTSSITQGEQPGVLFEKLFGDGLRIQFAHRSFTWASEARGKAHVHCVIIGFGRFEPADKPTLYDYDDPKEEASRHVRVKEINEYLVEGPPVLLHDRGTPIGRAPTLKYGSFALDGGHYTLDAEDRASILAESPAAAKYIRRFIGGNELLHNIDRWCLWLVDAPPGDLAKLTAVNKRVKAVRDWRAKRGRETTQELAKTPARFAEIRQPTSSFLAIPTTSLELRRFIPIAYLPPSVVPSNQVYVLANASLYEFGVLTSTMHMAWVRTVCGRLESRYRYSVGIVYNNFPWPTEVDAAKRAKVGACSQEVLDARAAFPSSTLAELYDPLAMPARLVKAHAALDKAVEKCYRGAKFTSDRERVEYLFALYRTLTSAQLVLGGGAPSAKKSKKPKGRKVP